MANSDWRRIGTDTRGEQSRRAVDRAYRTWWSLLRSSIARRFGAGPPDPEEAVQTAFERFAKLESPESITDPLGYLYTSARNYVLDQRRHHAVRSAGASTLEILETSRAASVLDAERVLIGKERLAIVEKALAAMDPRMREVMRLNIVQGSRSTEIARQIGLSDTRVRQLIAQGMAACLIALKADEMDGQV